MLSQKSVWTNLRMEIADMRQERSIRKRTREGIGMNVRKSLLATVGIVALLIGMAGTPMVGAQSASTTYRATLMTLNGGTGGSYAYGQATMTITGDDLNIHIVVEGVAPNMMHLQHFHGFAEGTANSICPTSKADTNGDGVVDLVETEPFVGVTMVPFHDDPVSMAIANDTYPKADKDGRYTYDKTVSLKALESAFTKAFPGQQLDLARRVVMIHGVPDGTTLPSTAASLPGVPAQVTLPVACGKILKDVDGTPAATPAS